MEFGKEMDPAGARNAALRAGLVPENGSLPGVTKERLREWTHTLEQYKAGKRNLESRIIEAEQFWKLRHWQSIRPHGEGEPEPASGWLVNAILSKHSDAVDAYPEPVCLAREEGDKAEAKMLSSVLPVVLRQNDFEKTWSDVWWYKLKSGTGVYGVFWDKSKLNGLGDIAIRKVDILNLFWEPGVQDIQSSKYLFHVSLQDNERIEAQYPAVSGKLKNASGLTVSRYIYDENISTSDKSAVVDVYYKQTLQGQTVLHYCKYVGETVLFATEGNPDYPQGWYRHGRYPFVFDPLFPEEGYPDCGYGYVDLCKDPQKIVDILNNCFVKNAVAGATPRWFIRSDGGVNEKEYADFTKPFVHTQGRLDQDSVMPIVQPALSPTYVNLMQMKVEEIKQVAGNRDVNNGGGSSRVTSASGLALLQEAGNGLSRDMISSGYRAVRKIVDLCIELIREFYDMPRKFRVLGKQGTEEYISYTNAGIQASPQGTEFGVDMGSRLPVFDIDVEVQSESTYTKSAYNDLAVQLYQLGAFQPQNTDTALMMLGMMDFKGKDELVRKVQQNGQMYQQLLAYQQMALALAQKYEPEMARGLAQQILGAGQAAPAKAVRTDGGNTGGKKEHAFVRRARTMARDGAKPR